ncbi:MAG: alpha/beta hydrolase [Chloroflexota bacterium]|nr:alpha/beta hydrolase [Chloroflexota bacterium]
MKATINGITMHYEVHGTGQPLLFIHGFPHTSKLWEPLVEPMKDDYRLIIPDLRGFGESEVTKEVSMGLYADDLAALLDEVGERDPVTVVGLSMGGYIAFEFFRRYPERVHALVLADTRPQADDEAGRKNRYESAQKALDEGTQELANTMAEKLFAPQASEELRSTWREIMASVPPLTIAAAQRAMANRPDSTDTLALINRPTLIVVGEEDNVTPPSDAERMHEAIEGSDLEIIPGAGHMTPVEQPERFVAILQQFLDDLDPVDRQAWPKRPDIRER